MFLLQGQAVCAGISCFQCPLCRDKDLFLAEMLIMGIQIPIRLVSFCPAHKTGGCKRGALPGPAPAAVALCCPLSLGFSFTEELETGQGGRSRDALHLPYALPGQQGLIDVPFSIRLPSWENRGAYAALSERHRRCDASECLCPGGREQAEGEG